MSYTFVELPWLDFSDLNESQRANTVNAIKTNAKHLYFEELDDFAIRVFAHQQMPAWLCCVLSDTLTSYWEENGLIYPEDKDD